MIKNFFHSDAGSVQRDDVADSRQYLNELFKRSPASSNRYLHFGKKASSKFMHFGKRASAVSVTDSSENADGETGSVNLDVKKRKRRLVFFLLQLGSV